MTKSERITKSLDNARTAAEEALAAGGQGRAERAAHMAIVNLVDAIEAIAGTGEKATEPAKAPAKKAPAKKAAKS